MTRYEKDYTKTIRDMLRHGSTARDGVYSVPCIVLSVDMSTGEFPILVYKPMDFDRILSVYTLQGISQMCKSVKAFELERGNQTSEWTVADGKLHCHAMLIDSNLYSEVPDEVVKFALDMHRFSEQYHCSHGSINIMMVNPFIKMDDWDMVDDYLSSVRFADSVSRVPVNPDYSRGLAVPRLEVIDGEYKLKGYPEGGAGIWLT